MRLILEKGFYNFCKVSHFCYLDGMFGIIFKET